MGSPGRLCKMSELCDIGSSKRIYAADYKTDGVPFYRGKEVIEKHLGKLNVSTELYINRAEFEQIRDKFGAPEPGDLLLTSVGTLGIPYIVRRGEEFYFKDGNLTWFRNFNKLDSRFLYYWLLSPQGRGELKKCTIGSSQPAFTIVLLKQMEIELKSISTQRKIAFILSAYDDLIEKNNRRIKILEIMAQVFYREWFVMFRFPGHEKVRMADSDFGQVPEGWDILAFRDLVEINPSMKVDKDKQKPYVDMAGLSNSCMVIECSITRNGNSGSKFQNGDTLFARITPCLENGKTGYVQFLDDEEIGIGSTEFIVFRSKKLTPEYVYLLARTDNFRGIAIKSMTGASGRQRVQNGCFDEIMLPVPPLEILTAFTNMVSPMFKQVHVLSNKNVNLRRTRDLLLPKLISGELDVGSLDIDTN